MLKMLVEDEFLFVEIGLTVVRVEALLELCRSCNNLGTRGQFMWLNGLIDRWLVLHLRADGELLALAFLF